MKEVPIQAKINDVERTIVIDGDPSWGKLKTILKSVVQADGKGGTKTDMDAFFDQILKLTIISGFDEIKDPVKLLQIPGTEMTYILGEILNILPLQTYFKNLRVLDNPLINLMNQ